MTTRPMQSAAERDGVVGAPTAPPLPVHPYHQPFTWWLRSRGYVLYMLRELSALPVAIWWLLFLVEVSRLHGGASGYHPLEAWFVVVSVICLVAAVYHSYTFLSLAGLIMRIPLGERNVAPRTIVGAAFSGFVVLTAVVAALLIWGGV